MSAEAMGWVFRHSPFKGATLVVHLCVADVVNDQHGNEFWMSVGNVAEKSRYTPRAVGMALAELTERGFLTILTNEDKQATGKPARYRFEFPDVEVVYESRLRNLRQVPPNYAPGPPKSTTGTSEKTSEHNSKTSSEAQVNAAPEVAARINAALDAIVERRFRSAPDVKSPAAWKRRVRRNLIADGTADEAAGYLAEFDGLSDGQLIGLLEGASELLRMLRANNRDQTA